VRQVDAGSRHSRVDIGEVEIKMTFGHRGGHTSTKRWDIGVSASPAGQVLNKGMTSILHSLSVTSEKVSDR